MTVVSLLQLTVTTTVLEVLALDVVNVRLDLCLLLNAVNVNPAETKLLEYAVS